MVAMFRSKISYVNDLNKREIDKVLILLDLRKKISDFKSHDRNKTNLESRAAMILTIVKPRHFGKKK